MRNKIKTSDGRTIDCYHLSLIVDDEGYDSDNDNRVYCEDCGEEWFKK